MFGTMPLQEEDGEIRRIFVSEDERSIETMSTIDEDTDNSIGMLVGSDEILNHPQVIEAPVAVNSPIPVPSIYTDGRGEIHNFNIGGMRLNLLYTKGGVFRSGDIHPTTKHDFVFSGRVRVQVLRVTGETTEQVYSQYDYISIPPYVPHVFEFLEDSIIAEWWDGPFYSWFYRPFRKSVEDSVRSLQHQKQQQPPHDGGDFNEEEQPDLEFTGTYLNYVVTSEDPNAPKKKNFQWANKSIWLCTGVAIGVTVATFLNKRSSK